MRTYLNITIMFFVIFGSLAGSFWLFPQLSSIQTNVMAESTPEATALYQDAGLFPTFPLMCPENIPISDGPRWRTITIGHSSLDDIENVYDVRFTRESELATPIDHFAPAYSVLLTAKGATKWKLPQSADLCLVDGKIMALSLSLGTDELPDGWIKDWVKLYGKPELVTWMAEGNDWCWREVVWPQHGISVSVDVSAVENHPEAALVDSVTLFPYAQGEDYLSDWPFIALNRQQPTSTNQGCPAEENPFDFESLLPTVTEQP